MIIFGCAVSIRSLLAVVTLLSVSVLGVYTVSAQSSPETELFTERYAEIQNTWNDNRDRETPFEELLQSVESYRDANPGNASAWIVLARVRFGYANTQGIVRGMRLMKEVRDELQKSVQLDAQAEQGFGQALLGFLYVGMPPWPLGFRNKDKGADYLAAAYRLNPDGMEINYYYAQYYASEKRFAQALQHVERARHAAYGKAVSPELRTYYLPEIEELQGSIEDRMK